MVKASRVSVNASKSEAFNHCHRCVKCRGLQRFSKCFKVRSIQFGGWDGGHAMLSRVSVNASKSEAFNVV